MFLLVSTWMKDQVSILTPYLTSLASGTCFSAWSHFHFTFSRGNAEKCSSYKFFQRFSSRQTVELCSREDTEVTAGEREREETKLGRTDGYCENHKGTIALSGTINCISFHNSFPFISILSRWNNSLKKGASSVSCLDDSALTQDWPRLSRRHRGILRNDDCFYISLHFLCVCVFYFFLSLSSRSLRFPSTHIMRTNLYLPHVSWDFEALTLRAPTPGLWCFYEELFLWISTNSALVNVV